MKFLSKAISAAAVCLALSACQNTVNTVENADKSATPNVIRDARFVTDGWLRDRLQLRSVKTAISASGHLMVEVAATNVRTGPLAQTWSGLTGENPYTVDYKFDWQDENGITVDTNLSIWQSRQIKPGETVYFKTVAPTPRCKDFILNIKEHN
jgi:uncharacterized protein YcfL